MRLSDCPYVRSPLMLDFDSVGRMRQYAHSDGWADTNLKNGHALQPSAYPLGLIAHTCRRNVNLPQRQVTERTLSEEEVLYVLGQTFAARRIIFCPWQLSKGLVAAICQKSQDSWPYPGN